MTYKRRKTVTLENKKRKENIIITEGSTAPLPPAALQIEAQNIEVEVIDEADENLTPVGRDADPRQDLETFGPSATSDTEQQRQVPTLQMTNTSVVAGSSFHARMTVHEETLRGDILTLLDESNAKIMERYEAHIRKLKDDGSKLIEELENQNAAALERIRILEERYQREATAAAERTRILEERHQRALENEQEAAAEKVRILEERLQIALSFESRSQSLEAENAKLYEELENGRAGNKALISEIIKKNNEITTFKHYSDMLVSDKIDLENKVKHLTKELENSKKEHARTARHFLDAARAVLRELGEDPH